MPRGGNGKDMLNARPISAPLFEPVTLALAKQQCRVSPEFTDDDGLLAVYIAAARNYVETKIQGSLFNRTWVRTIDNFPLAANYDTTISAADRIGWPVASQIANRVVIDLPGGLAQKINSLSYLDGNTSNVVTLDPALYQADLSSVPARLTPFNYYWPWQGQFMPGSVRVNYEIANFVSAVTGEAFTVPAPSGATSTYELAEPWATGLERLVDGTGAAVAGAVLATDGLTGISTLTLPGALAGKALTVDYDVEDLPGDITQAILLLVGHAYRNPEATTDLKLTSVPFGVDSLLGPHVITWGDYRPC
jgi:hypothetical protein